MTEERFELWKCNDNKNGVKDTTENKYYLDDEIVSLLNKQDKDNKLLREMLKNSYINQICENCEYGHYYSYELPFQGIEYDFKCLKKHFGNEHWRCAELKECDDFQLKLEELE